MGKLFRVYYPNIIEKVIKMLETPECANLTKKNSQQLWNEGKLFKQQLAIHQRECSDVKHRNSRFYDHPRLHHQAQGLC